MQPPSPGRVVMFHFWIDGNPLKRPAMIVDVGDQLNVCDLFVFFKPEDRWFTFSRDPKYVESVMQSHTPVDALGAQHGNRTWSWPRRVE